MPPHLLTWMLALLPMLAMLVPLASHASGAAQPATTRHLQANAATQAGATRNPLQAPFASDSIWNMPIGSGAQYVHARLPAVPGNESWAMMPQLDEEIIVLEPDAPMTPVRLSDAAWSGKDRCEPTGGFLLEVPMPADFVIPNSKGNNSAAFLAPDGRTLLQAQPLTRCRAGGVATALVQFKPVDLYGDGRHGAHGGSGLSAIGGSLRLGELRPGGPPPRHALKLDLYGKDVFYQCQNQANCFRWPAYKADSGAVGRYGIGHGNINSNPLRKNPPPFAMRMGALLAIPAKQDLATLGLETKVGQMLAWTLQNYGAYVVDDAGGPSVAISAEKGPRGSFRQQFRQDWGFDFEQRVRNNTPWMRDMQRLIQALHVVDNNSPATIGGGGTPLQPLAAPLQEPATNTHRASEASSAASHETRPAADAQPEKN